MGHFMNLFENGSIARNIGKYKGKFQNYFQII